MGNLINGTKLSELLNGTEADDDIFAGAGNDTLIGGGGNDVLDGDAGNDSALGGSGDDQFERFQFGTGNDYYDGGDGNDIFKDTLGRDTMIGGPGDDYFLIERNVLTGTDYHVGAEGVATGGPGVDRYDFGRNLGFHQNLGNDDGENLKYVIKDFTSTLSGDAEDDVIILDTLLTENALLGNPTSYQGGNPFASDQRYLRLVAFGDEKQHTQLRLDPDGVLDNEAKPTTLLTLLNIRPSEFSAANFQGGIAPDGSAVPGMDVSGDGTLEGGFFNDSITGGDENDTIDGSGGDDLIDAGAGDDSISGGAGDDTINGGEGDDFFVVDFAGQDSRVTGGSGKDTYFIEPALEASRGYFVTDFMAGAGGDAIDIYRLLLQSASMSPLWPNGTPYTEGNPFDPQLGYLRLVDFEGGTRLEWDLDGAPVDPDEPESKTWRSVITLEGVSRDDLTSENFVGGVQPDGSEPVGQEFVVSLGKHRLTGGIGNDTMTGDGEADRLYGNAGNDEIDAGDGNDTVLGGVGDDLVFLGAGNDNTFPDGGRAGLDHNVEILGNDTIYGGDGEDFFYDTFGDNLLYGDGGIDTFHIQSHDAGSSTIYGGDGEDNYELLGSKLVRTVIADFQVGPGGDLINVRQLLGASESGGFYSEGNPLKLGFLRLRQLSNGDTTLDWDQDGAGTRYRWVTQITLGGIAAANLTSDNFTGQLITGDDSNNDLFATIGNDTVEGLGGNDTLDGSLGADILEGGAGEDLYFVDHINDQVIEDDNDPPPGGLVIGGGRGGLAAGDGITDTVRAAVTYGIGNFVENLMLVGSGHINGTGNELANILKGNGKNNTLLGLAGDDRLEGSSGNDTLDGGGGADTVIGGTGNDMLIWSAGSGIL